MGQSPYLCGVTVFFEKIKMVKNDIKIPYVTSFFKKSCHESCHEMHRF